MDPSVPLESLPEWLYWVIGGGTAIVTVGKATGVVKRVMDPLVAKLGKWIGGLIDDRIEQTAGPLIKKHSPNGQLDRIEFRLEDHIDEANSAFNALRTDLDQVAEEVDQT